MSAIYPVKESLNQELEEVCDGRKEMTRADLQFFVQTDVPAKVSKCTGMRRTNAASSQATVTRNQGVDLRRDNSVVRSNFSPKVGATPRPT